MKNLFLLLLIFIGASMSVPALRVRVAPRVQPVWARVRGEVTPLVRSGLNPVFRWAAAQEAESIARDLERREAAGQRLPAPHDLTRFLQNQRYNARDGLDPWGQPYGMILRSDSIVIFSGGPDLERHTEDDVRAGVPRR